MRYIAILLTCVLAVGCQGFLEKEPLTQVTTENFYQTESQALEALFAAYSTLQYDGQLSPSGHFRWFWGDVVSDDSEKGGSGPNDAASLGRFERFEGRATSELIAAEWQAAYDGVYYANVVLESVPGIDMDPFLKAQILAEAKFIRAYNYYNLVIMFGGVPLVNKVLAPSEDLLPRATADEIWAFINTELEAAIPNLPLRSQYEVSETGRISQGAAQALLQRAYAWQNNWDGALALGQDIIASNEYRLAENYAGIFSQTGENGPGSVFEIQFMSSSNGDWGRFEEGNLSNVFQRARGEFGGYGFNIPTQELVDAYETDDPRFEATIFQVGDVMGDRGEFTLDRTGYPYEYYARKYFISRSEEAPTGDPNVNGPSNDRVIRYADVLLLTAEAAYQTGNEALARSLVNEVRARARNGNDDVLPDVSASGPSLLEAIYRERRVELALEGHRFFDLVRTGRAAAAMQAQGLNFTAGVHERFPIPLIEIQLSNGTLEQNPGY